MAWYYILFFVSFGFFIIKSLISWIFGDIDVDFDFDGDVDFDISSMFSFKGLLHFLIGFSTYLSVTARLLGDKDAVYHFTVAQYIVGALIGIGFMFIMFFAYKMMAKLDHNSEEIDLNGQTCSILINNGPISELEYSYTVLVNTVCGSRKITVLSKASNLAIGSEHTIYTNKQGIYYIN